MSELKNIDEVLQEFKDYSTEVDIEFVCNPVRAIDRSAMLQKAAERFI